MDNPLDLYAFAEERGIDVDWITMPQADSLSILMPGGSFCIALDPWKMHTLSKEIVSLAHELGHCETGSFYNKYATLDIREKHEHRADKWAIEHLVPAADLRQAAREGHTELWDLAEYFDVTEDFMQKAVWYHRHGNLAVGA